MESSGCFSSLCLTICSTDRSAITLGKLFLFLLKHQILGKGKINKLHIYRRMINRISETTLDHKPN